MNTDRRRAALATALVGLVLAVATGCGSSAAAPAKEKASTATRPTRTTTTTTEPEATTTSAPPTTTTSAPPTTVPPTTTPPTAPPTTTTAAPHERSSFDLGRLTCANTGETYLVYVRAFNGSIYAVAEDFQTYAYEISEQIGETVDRSTYPQLDPARPEFNQGTVDALRNKAQPYLCEAGD